MLITDCRQICATVSILLSACADYSDPPRLVGWEFFDAELPDSDVSHEVDDSVDTQDAVSDSQSETSEPGYDATAPADAAVAEDASSSDADPTVEGCAPREFICLDEKRIGVCDLEGRNVIETSLCGADDTCLNGECISLTSNAGTEIAVAELAPETTHSYEVRFSTSDVVYYLSDPTIPWIVPPNSRGMALLWDTGRDTILWLAPYDSTNVQGGIVELSPTSTAIGLALLILNAAPITGDIVEAVHRQLMEEPGWNAIAERVGEISVQAGVFEALNEPTIVDFYNAWLYADDLLVRSTDCVEPQGAGYIPGGGGIGISWYAAGCDRTVAVRLTNPHTRYIYARITDEAGRVIDDKYLGRRTGCTSMFHAAIRA